MGAGMKPKGGGGGGVLGFDFFGNQGANPRPNLRDFSNPASATTSGFEGMRRRSTIPESVPAYEMAAAGKPTIRHTPSSQTEAQRQAFDTAENNWARIDAARKKRQEAYLAMAQKTGDVPREYRSRAGKREAGDPLSPVQAAGGLAPSDPMARYGRPKRWPYLQSIVNMGQVT